jgi:pantoate--beta-alanine ligase
MQLVHGIEDLRASLEQERSIGLVPTMGALHEGHGALIDQARSECGCVVVSLFVNPIQFDRGADFERYPRTLETDATFCERRTVDILFAPSAEEMYPHPQRTFVEVTTLSDHLCGRFRPGHFRGVATVVLKLLAIVRPHRAYFGEKDAQQLAVIRRMVADLNVAVEIIGVPTVREPDGLALSSRNARLTSEERKLAPYLYRSLRAASQCVEHGQTNPAQVREAGSAVLLSGAPGMKVEYFEIVDPDEMQPVERIAGPVTIAAAVWLGSTRLIDNVRAIPPQPQSQGFRC